MIALVGLLALMASAGFRSAPGVLMIPLEAQYGWPLSVMSTAVSTNLVLFGLTAPFAAALMDRLGVRTVVSGALVLIALGSGLTVFATHVWHLLLTWGVLIGLGTGSMAQVFAATIANRWFVKHRGLVLGVLSAGMASGQLVTLPVIAALAERVGWRTASLAIAGLALAVVPLLLVFMRDRPSDLGVRPVGAGPEWVEPAEAPRGNAFARTLGVLAAAARRPAFWALAGAFAICGATTNGLIGVHFVPSAHDHGMATTTAASLLAAVGIFDVVGTILSGWLTDRFDPRLLLGVYYFFRGVGLACLPVLLSDRVHVSMVIFVVVYGLDWVATVPPTVTLCREIFGESGTIVFGWVFASHQMGAALAASAAGLVRDTVGTYTYAWIGGAVLCVLATVLSVAVRRPPIDRPGRSAAA
ncbi:MFS transporter [Brevibacterium samyangense]|uniref:MFS transporter n=1 Tax=Brevibacterium samyangense TaxID=366888 RepID=A0ABP5F0A3_9MICO